jgi:hypothetical protein
MADREPDAHRHESAVLVRIQRALTSVQLHKQDSQPGAVKCVDAGALGRLEHASPDDVLRVNLSDSRHGFLLTATPAHHRNN